MKPSSAIAFASWISDQSSATRGVGGGNERPQKDQDAASLCGREPLFACHLSLLLKIRLRSRHPTKSQAAKLVAIQASSLLAEWTLSELRKKL
jgi:hypothetical protein